MSNFGIDALFIRMGACRHDAMQASRICTAGMALAISVMVAAYLLVGAKVLAFAPAVLLAPLLTSTALVMWRQDSSRMRPEMVLNQAPEIIGAMGVSISQYGSLDLAVRNVSEEGDSYLHRMLQDAAWRVDTRKEQDIKEAMMRSSRELATGLSPVRRSLNLLMAACEVEGGERQRMVDDANESVTIGLREMGDAYCAGLNVPAMVIFSLVVMVPVIAMSLLPLLSFSGMEGSAVMGSVLPALILVAVPLVASVYLLHLVRTNPFRESSGIKGLKPFLWLLAMPPSALAVYLITNDAALALMSSLALPSLAAHLFSRPSAKQTQEKEKTAECLRDSLLEVGNRMLSGEPLFSALEQSLPDQSEGRQVWQEISNGVRLGRDDERRVLQKTLAPISGSLASAYAAVSRSAEKDPRAAGSLCVNMGRMLQSQATVRKNIQNQLRGMMDMMNGTAAVFAPLILGISSSMMIPLINGGFSGLGGLSMVLGLYLVELCLISAFMTTYLMGRGGAAVAMRKFTVLLPTAIIVFLLTSGLGG
ncbi:MAG: hypothetical protein PHW93_03685 [Candidatus Methanomethylophilaceae archaeon]|nr:hypothetical protein [Candidatus Methanomethylophilaceae archaeon]